MQPSSLLRPTCLLALASVFMTAFTPAASAFVGMDRSRSAAILEQFKKQEKIILFETSPFPQDLEKKLFIAEKKANALAKMLIDIQSTKNQYKELKK